MRISLSKIILSRTATIRIIRGAIIALAVLLIGGYATWRSFDYTRGPEVIITGPLNGATIYLSTTTTTTTLTGRVERAQDLFINGRLVSIDETGDFSESIVVFPGINRIKVSTKDQFARTAEKVVEILGVL
jgi:hypothetical protein